MLGGVALVVALAAVFGMPERAPAATDEWPRRFQDSKREVLVYQPQLEDFNDDRLSARAAVSARKKEWKDPVFGAIWIDARVSVDRDTRMASIHNIKITDVKFPSASPEDVATIKDFMNEQLEGDVHTIAMDRLVAAMQLVEKQREQDANLGNDPPKIIYRSQPAVLVLLDGEPKLMPVPDSPLMRVVNTPFVMLYAPSDKAYYLRAGETWAMALALQGPWKPVETLPQAIQDLQEKVRREAARQAEKQGVKGERKGGAKAGPSKTDGSAQKVEMTEGGDLPEIVVVTEPSELIVTEGEPQYTPIEGTNLLYVSNTDNNIFMDASEKQFYVLLSGRWFKGASLENGPWTYVPSTGLPSDFAKIPEGSVKGFVLVSVAGTQEAREAVMDSYIPQTAAIDRGKASIEIKYDGDPEFEKIPNVDVEYAVNTPDAVFKAQGKYFACVDAVWYESPSPTGPWKVSVEVAGDIYKIPPSNPHYNARYVKVYDSTDDVAYVGYTPGYTGSYVDEGAVVYGTGYRYPTYSSGTTYIPSPSTYGYSAVYNPYQATWGYQPVYYNPYSWLAPAIVGVGVGIAVAAIVDNWRDDYRYPYYRGWWGGGGYHYHNVHYHHHYHHNNAGWRPRPTPYWRPGDRPTWRPGERPWRPGSRPGWRPGDRPGWAGNRPDWRPGDRPGRPGDRPGWRPGDRPGRPTTLPATRPNLYNRPGMENKLADASQIRRPGRGDRLEARPVSTRPGGDRLDAARPGAGRPAMERPAARPARGEGRPDKALRPASEQMKRNNVFADQEGNVYRRDRKGNWQQRDTKGWSSVDRTSREQVGRPSREGDRARREVVSRPARRPAADTARLNQEFRARERGAERANQFRGSQSFETRSAFGRSSGGSRGGDFSGFRGSSRGGDRSGFRAGGGGRGGGGEGRGGRGGGGRGGGGGGRGGGGRGR